MSYCVNCGVELDPSQKACPLCDTPVINPNESMDMEAIPPYPNEDTEMIVESMRRSSAILITMIFVIPLILCPLCNFIITGRLTWSIYVIISVIYTWVVLVTPIVLHRRRFLTGCLFVDFAATGVFLYVLNQFAMPEHNWFMKLAMPILLLVMAGIFMCIFVYRITHRAVTVISAGLAVSGCVSMFVEYLILSFIGKPVVFIWSVPVIISCFGAAILLMVISKMTKFKSSFRKRMHI